MFSEILTSHDESVKVFFAVSGVFVGQGQFKGSSMRLRNGEEAWNLGDRIEGVILDVALVKSGVALRLEFRDGATATVLPRSKDTKGRFIVVQGIEHSIRME